MPAAARLLCLAALLAALAGAATAADRVAVSTDAEAVVAKQLLAAMTVMSGGSSDTAIAMEAPADLSTVNVSDVASRVIAAAVASYQTSVVYAASNRGLKPTRLKAFDRTHYYQLAKDPVGTLVSEVGREGDTAGGRAAVRATAAAAAPAAAAGELPRLRPQRQGLLPL